MGKILHKYKNSIITIKMNAVILGFFFFIAKQKASIQIPESNACRLRGWLHMCSEHPPSYVYMACDILAVFRRSRPTASLTLHTPEFGFSPQASCILH